jgi:tryptophan-rich sensory protein
MKEKWKVYMIWILIVEAVGALSGWLSREGMMIYSETIIQPPLAPPGWLFPLVWTLLYALMGIGAARIWLAPDSQERRRGLNLFVAQLIVNFFWSLIFFNLQTFGFAFIWLLLLWGLVVWMILTFYQVEQLAAWLQLPYLVWLTFAAYLSGAVWIINR